MNALKYLKWTVIGITGLFLSLVLFLAVWIDPNDYRDDVTALVKENTGLILEIKGDIGWNFFPAIGFSVAQLSLATTEGGTPLAAIGKVAVSVQLMPLFQRRINVNTLFVDGLRADLVVDETGKGNWEALMGEAGAAEMPADPETADSGTALEINLPQVVITNSVLDYQDRATPAHYRVVLKEFVADDISLDREFAFRLRASADDHKGLTADIDLRSFVQLDMAAETCRVRALELKSDIAGIFEKPFQVTVGSNAVVNLKTQQVNVEQLLIDAGNLHIAGKPARATLGATVAGNLETMLFTVSQFDGEVNDLAVGARPVRIKFAADVVADLKQQLFNIDSLAVEAGNLDFTGKPVAARLQGKVVANLADDTASVGPLRFSAAGIDGTLAIDARELTRELAWQGTLGIEPFNAKDVMRNVGIAPPQTADAAAMTKVALTSALAGTMTRAMLDNLEIRLDHSTIKGKAGITDLENLALVFDLALNDIDADHYLPPPEAVAATDSAAAGEKKPAADTPAKPEPLLPVATLRALNIEGSLTAGKVVFMAWPMNQLSLGIHAKDGKIRVDPINATVLDGSISGNVRIDARGNEPHIVTALKLRRLEIGPLVQRYAGKDLFLGKASLDLDMDATGNDMDTLLRKAIGSADLSFADATLRGVNLNNVLSEALTQQLGAFAMLVPDYQQKLPRELQQDTLFSTLATGVKLKDGVAEMPALAAGLKDGKVSGQGSFNLLSLDFDYRMAVRTERLQGNKYLANAEFPVQCKGNVAGAPADWCRPDTQAMGDMLKKAAENAAKDRLKGELAQQLGVDSVDSGALREQAQQAVDQQKVQVEQKAKERVNEELQKRLKKIF